MGKKNKTIKSRNIINTGITIKSRKYVKSRKRKKHRTANRTVRSIPVRKNGGASTFEQISKRGENVEKLKPIRFGQAPVSVPIANPYAHLYQGQFGQSGFASASQNPFGQSGFARSPQIPFGQPTPSQYGTPSIFSKPQPAKPQPAKPQPAEPQPAEPQPAEQQPAEPQPAEPQPAEQQPAEPQPAEKVSNANRTPLMPSWNRGSVSAKEPSSVSLISYERQKVLLRMTIYNPDGKTILKEIRHVVSSDLSPTIDSFLSGLTRNNSIDYKRLSPSLRSVLRVGAMMPKIAADSAGSWQVGEYIRQNFCVLEYQPSTEQNIKHISCIVINYDTDTETFWFSDAIVFNHIPSTDYYSGNVFSFIKSEIMNIMMSLAHLDLFKPEHTLLKDTLNRLMLLHGEGLDLVKVLECKDIIESEFKKIGRFEFNYQKGGKTIMVFHPQSTPTASFTIDLESNNPKARQLTYLKIVEIITKDENQAIANKMILSRFNDFKNYTTMDFRFVTLSALFRNMFGMDENFFQYMKFRALESLSKHNHDALRDRRINDMSPPEITPIRNLAVFKVFTDIELEHPQVVWVPVPDARKLVVPGIYGCTSIANGSFPHQVQTHYGDVVMPESCPGVYSCYPSIRVNTRSQVFSSSFDSQRSIIRIPSNRSFFHTIPIHEYTISGGKKLSFVEGDESKVIYKLTYKGTPKLIFSKDDQPFKGIGIVYLRKNGEIITVDGNVTKGNEEFSLYDNLLLLLKREYNSNFLIPHLVKMLLRVLFGENRRRTTYNVNMIDKIVREFVTYGRESKVKVSLYSFISALDDHLGILVSAGTYQRQIDTLKQSTEPVCPLFTRQSSLGPAEAPVITMPIKPVQPFIDMTEEGSENFPEGPPRKRPRPPDGATANDSLTGKPKMENIDEGGNEEDL